jgi:hypothetical protein
MTEPLSTPGVQPTRQKNASEGPVISVCPVGARLIVTKAWRPFE